MCKYKLCKHFASELSRSGSEEGKVLGQKLLLFVGTAQFCGKKGHVELSKNFFVWYKAFRLSKRDYDVRAEFDIF